MSLGAIGCSRRQHEAAPLLDAVAELIGFQFPADASVLAYHHRHNGKSGDECSQLWIIKSSSPLPGPSRNEKQTRAKSPFKSLQLLIEQLTDKRVAIEPTESAVCECVEWRHGDRQCRLRQAKARDGWFSALEVVSPE
jgi:hypothetical protein